MNNQYQCWTPLFNPRAETPIALDLEKPIEQTLKLKERYHDDHRDQHDLSTYENESIVRGHRWQINQSNTPSMFILNQEMATTNVNL